MRELLGLPKLPALIELNQLLGLPGLQELPGFPLPALGRAPGHKPGTTETPRTASPGIPPQALPCASRGVLTCQRPKNSPALIPFRASDFGFRASGFAPAAAEWPESGGNATGATSGAARSLKKGRITQRIPRFGGFRTSAAPASSRKPQE